MAVGCTSKKLRIPIVGVVVVVVVVEIAGIAYDHDHVYDHE
jgi:hypothetical protein